MPKIEEPHAQPVDFSVTLLGENVADGDEGAINTLRFTFPTKRFEPTKLTVVCWL